MSDIGLRLFQQLKAIDPSASRDDYFHEEKHSWDISGLEEDLKVAEDRIQQTGSSTIVTVNEEEFQIETEGANTHCIAVPSIETTHHSNHDPQNNNNHSLVHHLPTSLHSPNTIQRPPQSSSTEYDDDDEDIDMNPPQEQIVSTSNDTDCTNPTQMPSPSASPSIDEYEENDPNTDSDREGRNEDIENTLNPTTLNIRNSRKRKSEDTNIDDLHSVKRRKMTAEKPMQNQWNEIALKKLRSLRRVQNSAWFWEPVDETKHTAPYYHLVCPLASDYGTICKRLEQRAYDHLDDFLRDCELVFINARIYNVKTHAVHMASMKLERRFKESMNGFVETHCKQYGSDQTWPCWQKAVKNYKPFAVPIHYA